LELLAGCSGLANREFVADAVVLPQADQEELGFASVVEKTGTVSADDVSAETLSGGQ